MAPCRLPLCNLCQVRHFSILPSPEGHLCFDPDRKFSFAISFHYWCSPHLAGPNQLPTVQGCFRFGLQLGETRSSYGSRPHGKSRDAFETVWAPHTGVSLPGNITKATSGSATSSALAIFCTASACTFPTCPYLQNIHVSPYATQIRIHCPIDKLSRSQC